MSDKHYASRRNLFPPANLGPVSRHSYNKSKWPLVCLHILGYTMLTKGNAEFGLSDLGELSTRRRA